MSGKNVETPRAEGTNPTATWSYIHLQRHLLLQGSLLLPLASQLFPIRYPNQASILPSEPRGMVGPPIFLRYAAILSMHLHIIRKMKWVPEHAWFFHIAPTDIHGGTWAQFPGSREIRPKWPQPWLKTTRTMIAVRIKRFNSEILISNQS